MPSALFVVSEEGYWGEECVVPLQTLTDAGVDCTVATPTGEPPVVDDRSIDPDEVGEELAARVVECDTTDDRMKDPTPLARVDAAVYDAVVFPGGHGAEWDINQDRHARALLSSAVAGHEGCALVVCHAVGILAFARGERGDVLVDGRDVTGFPNEWEEGILDDDDRMPDGRKLPYLVEDEVVAAGAKWDAQLDRETSVRVDGDLLTARGPESSEAAATALLDHLGVDAD